LSASGSQVCLFSAADSTGHSTALSNAVARHNVRLRAAARWRDSIPAVGVLVASTPAQFGAAIGEIVRQRSQAVVVVQDPVYFGERAKLQELMQATRLPVAYGLREHVVAGGLLSYTADLAANWRYAAKYVDKILKGAKPADLPIEQPTKFELVNNLKTANALGLTIPPAVLLRADEVIQ
jgi:putative ABC transport system substrate-binding protein